jgi:Alkylmercury lyase
MADRDGPPAAGERDELARRVRQHVYQWFADSGRAPSPVELARAFGVPPSRIERVLEELATGADALVLLPGSAYVWMAEPFSAVPTSFLVGSGERRWWGNCIWDALAILALLEVDGWVATACPDCGAELRVEVAAGLLAGDGVAHFAVPARDWWRSIGFT